jgi:hypothetical protein
MEGTGELLCRQRLAVQRRFDFTVYTFDVLYLVDFHRFSSVRGEECHLAHDYEDNLSRLRKMRAEIRRRQKIGSIATQHLKPRWVRR